MRMVIRIMGVVVLVAGAGVAAVMNNMPLLAVTTAAGLALYLIGRSK